ncbi:MAG TPA: hypothetical protein VH114_15915 [Candidatus Acidoferrum sp.]|nr:hypothetical protein [Candidatus Acidoferrum sp.]
MHSNIQQHAIGAFRYGVVSHCDVGVLTQGAPPLQRSNQRLDATELIPPQRQDFACDIHAAPTKRRRGHALSFMESDL